jgi:hypothetical protein
MPFTLNTPSAVRFALGPLTAVALVLTLAVPASAQRAGSWVDIGNGIVGSGASASGPLQFAKSKSSSKNGVDFGHGFAVGAGPNGIAISNSIGAGSGPLGAAHNLNLNIGARGAHLSHGGVISEGGNRRVIAGGGTGVQNGQVYGGSTTSGFGNRTRAWSNSHTHQWNQPRNYSGQSLYYSPSGQSSRRSGSTSSQNMGRMLFGRGFRAN